MNNNENEIITFTKATNVNFSGLLKLGNHAYTVDQLNEALRNAGIGTGYSTIIYCDELPSTIEVELNTIYICNDALNVYTGSKWVSSNDISNLAEVAYSGNYSDLINKPNLSTVAISGKYNDLINKPNLSTVATTGSYNDLINKPEVFSEDRGIILEQKVQAIETTLGELEILTDNILGKMGIDDQIYAPTILSTSSLINQQRSFNTLSSPSLENSSEQNKAKKEEKPTIVSLDDMISAFEYHHNQKGIK